MRKDSSKILSYISAGSVEKGGRPRTILLKANRIGRMIELKISYKDTDAYELVSMSFIHRESSNGRYVILWVEHQDPTR